MSSPSRLRVALPGHPKGISMDQLGVDSPGWALVTGASSGIGTALSEVLAEHGHSLVIVGRNRRRLDELCDRLQRDRRVAVHVIECDLSAERAAEALAAKVAGLGVTVDILVNNAGMIVYGEFATTGTDDERRMIGVNLIALTELTKALLPGMIERRRGFVLNLGSTGSFAPSPFNAVFSATKAYVLSFSEAIAEELQGTGVSVTALCPGAVKSELQSRAGMQDVRLLSGRVMDPRHVAEVGYRALMARRTIVVTGGRERLAAFLGRFLPRKTVVRYARRMLERV